MKLSIIIPVYNVEPYVERCLRSCIAQNISTDDYEIVVINDGTTDDSLSIVERIQTECPHIRIYSQENAGLSAARNKGLLLARGNYVWFVDSDDWIEKNCLSELSRSFDDEIECLTFNYTKFYDNATSVVCSNHFEGVLSGMQVMARHKIHSAAQFTVYKKSFLLDHDLFFYTGILHEDAEFTPRAYYFARRCKSINCLYYYYYQRESNSIMASYGIKNARDILFINNRLLDFADSCSMDTRSQSLFYDWIGLNINTCLSRFKRLNTSDRQRVKQLLLAQKRMFRAMRRSHNLKYSVEGWLFYFLPRITFTLFSTYNHTRCLF
jgi:glycosyltransferase involved in cell wall biosynthesis